MAFVIGVVVGFVGALAVIGGALIFGVVYFVVGLFCPHDTMEPGKADSGGRP